MCVLSNHKVTGYNPHDRTMHVTKYQVPTLKQYNASYKRGLYIQEEIHPSFQCGTLVPKNFEFYNTSLLVLLFHICLSHSMEVMSELLGTRTAKLVAVKS